nr:Chain E, Cation-Independent Mannose 6-phosphate receptor1JPL_F Chain F, Cation-Independent Mannose 6-phosphate receptor1JPL_G Chain G, Cation-Independent Mannose 6-phosphate receptor1JPL_H Chain H, Cation-Independent Mannose 6-phosphate receptor
FHDDSDEDLLHI